MNDKPIVYLENGVTVFRASALAQCQKALVAARMGFEGVGLPEWFQEKLDESSELEYEVGEKAEGVIGKKVLRPGEIDERVELWITNKIMVRGHIDGVIDEGSPAPIFEAKALGQDFFDKWRAGGISMFPYYAAQLTLYMRAWPHPDDPSGRAYFAVLNKATGEIDVTYFDQYPADLNELMKRAIEVDRLGREEQLPEECDTERSLICPFPYLHDSEEGEEEVDEEEFDTLVNQYLNAKQEVDKFEAIKKEVSKKLEAYLDEHDLKKAHHPRASVSIVEQERRTIDKQGKAKMKEDGVDPSKYEKVSVSRYPKVTPKEKKDGGTD